MSKVLPDLKQMSREDLIAALVAAQAAPARKLTLKVTEKGCISLYHGSRFPTTLYAEQWERVLGHADAIRAFINANAASLSYKDRAAA